MSDVPARAATRRILLLDCDQFFVQCARLADPDGAGREALLLVGGSVESRGVVTSASYETRVFGVRSGMPTGQALRLCPRARVVPVPRRICGEKSRAIRAVLARWSPLVEAASIDEAYIDLSGTERLYHDEPLADTARRIQREVLAGTQIQTSVGGGTSKLVAKLAVERAKPAGVHVVAPGEERAFLATFRLADIPGVGPVFTEELRRYGLVSVADVQGLGEKTLGEVLGAGRGDWLWQKALGIDHGAVHVEHEQKSFSRDETFPRDLHRTGELEKELLALAGRLGADLRDAGMRARTITVRVRDADFRNRSASRTVAEPLESDRAIYALARELLAKLRAARRIGARLLGVAASNLVPQDADASQLGLFGESARLESEKDRRLSRTADEIRERFGRNSLKPGRLLSDE
jgi:DNA polymerase-4